MWQFMRRYRWRQTNYRVGERVALTEAEARAINRDEPGTVEPVVEEQPIDEPQARMLDDAPADRMMRRRGAR